ncbi:hypothetical protein P7L53_11425 [Thermoleptolyngbya sichuanensis XZ-Cy5]|nr:hypothetical protein [Thermoleptolyngbya sichuanensis]MDG2616853.1 hypothetical protein [Thermoleptolyngbya sichuanensis XZ-Cy5]
MGTGSALGGIASEPRADDYSGMPLDQGMRFGAIARRAIEPGHVY